MFALIVGVKRARLVLGVLDVLGRPIGIHGTGKGEEQISGPGLSNLSRSQAVRDVIVVDRLKVIAFETDMQKADGCFLGNIGVRRIQFQKLVIVDLDEALPDLAILVGECKGLLEAELLVKPTRGVKRPHTNCNMSDPRQRWRLLLRAEEWSYGNGEYEKRKRGEAAQRSVGRALKHGVGPWQRLGSK